MDFIENIYAKSLPSGAYEPDLLAIERDRLPENLDF